MASGPSRDSPATTLRGRRAQNLELVVQIRGPEAQTASAACAAPAPSRRAWAPLLSGSPCAHLQNVPRNSQGSRVWATQVTTTRSTWARRAQHTLQPGRTSALPPSPPRWGGATTTAPLFAGWRGRAPSSARGRYPGRGSGRPGGRAVRPPRGARRGAGCCAGWSSGLGARRREDRRDSGAGEGASPVTSGGCQGESAGGARPAEGVGAGRRFISGKSGGRREGIGAGGGAPL